MRGGVTEMSLGKRTVPSFMAGGGGGGGAGAAHAHNNGASTSDADLDVGPSMGYDAEAAEAENDRVAGQLGDRVRLLRSITKDIHDEVESQNRLLDNLGGGDGQRQSCYWRNHRPCHAGVCNEGEQTSPLCRGRNGARVVCALLRHARFVVVV